MARTFTNRNIHQRVMLRIHEYKWWLSCQLPASTIHTTTTSSPVRAVHVQRQLQLAEQCQTLTHRIVTLIVALSRTVEYRGCTSYDGTEVRRSSNSGTVLLRFVSLLIRQDSRVVSPLQLQVGASFSVSDFPKSRGPPGKVRNKWPGISYPQRTPSIYQNIFDFCIF